MSDVVPYGLRNNYPHMMPEDRAIWERFIKANPSAYDTCEYDVKVGSPPVFDTVVNQDTGGDAINLYKKKIDVVAYKNGRIDIIELKPRADMRTLGQVRGYGNLYKREFNPPEGINLVVITNELLTDMDHLSVEEGVKLIIV